MCDTHLKVSQPPFLTLLDFFGEVDVASAQFVVNKDERVVTAVLRKAAPAVWPALEFAAASPAALQERREAGLARKAALDEQVSWVGERGRGEAGPRAHD